jgi:alcohol dehydrogenase
LLTLATSHQLDASRFATHHFTLDRFINAYDTFARAGETAALKLVLTATD